ncbi:NAD(P)-dependent oxidoreductase [Salipiger sp. HF18]|uniref:NAD-dependent epimerase/dehydratase family protein n=1 Tax=Salipiger sp. HF18 TaxID=2721557 RepID=UPI00142D2A5C|nr:NAD(P)-dependent oxidoreductase [Salipiger sp. HF18]NIY95149.1 NAD(P)-dependent oxidoreductase [Salipiger sp. HF18]
MGDVTRLLITGAGGFIGRATVAEARARGLEVTALVRRTCGDWAGDTGVTVLTCDLAEPASVATIAKAAQGCGAVIHAAAHPGADARAIPADALAATRHLLEALPPAMRLVLVSSIAVYDLSLPAPGAVLDEGAALCPPGRGPDPYANAKLAQEALCRASGHPLWLIRPGAAWGPGRTWHALNGVDAMPLHLTLASEGALPLAHVTQVAKALVSAALTAPEGVEALNVVDDDLPTRGRFVSAHRRAAGWPRVALSLPWTAWLGLARALRPVSAHLPGLLREPVLRARILPLQWPNTALRARLGGQDDAPFEEMLRRSLEGRA